MKIGYCEGMVGAEGLRWAVDKVPGATPTRGLAVNNASLGCSS